MKRALTLLLTFLMVASLAIVPALAYEAPSVALWDSEWHADLNIAFNNQSATPLNSLVYDQSVPGTTTSVSDPFNSDVLAQSKDGALNLNNSGKITAATGYIRNTLTAGAPDTTNHNLVGTTGSTIDLGVRFDNLPTATSNILKVDASGNFTTSGYTSNPRGQLGRQLGFVLNVQSVSDFINADGSVKLHPSGSNAGKPYSTEYYISFVAYDNAVKGTNAAIIFISGSASGFTSTSWTAVREVYFCNLDFGADAEYHRYTFTTDYSKGLVGEDMVTLYIDGVETTTFTAPAYRNYSASAEDAVKMSLNLNGYCETASDGALSMGVSLDQLSIYGTALTPKDATMSTFNEEAPLYTGDYVAALAAANALTASDYSKKTWKPIAEALAAAAELPEVGVMNKDNVSQQQLDAITQQINDGIAGLRFNAFDSAIEEKRLYIPFSYYDSGSGYAYAWTNSTILFTNPNYDIATYKVNNADLNDFMSIVFEPTSTAGTYKVVEVSARGTAMAKRTTHAPSGGFIIFTHNNLPGTSSSRYASQLFGDANAAVSSQIEVGQFATLENVTLNASSAATLQTTGIWRSRYDPVVLANPNSLATSDSPACIEILYRYPYTGTDSVKWRDQFDDFSTTSALVMQLPVGAYKDEYNLIAGKIASANEDHFTAESWKNLQDVLATVNMDDPNLNQDMIDDWTDALNAAYDALVKLNDPNGGGANNPGSGQNTGDTDFVLVTLGVIAFLAVTCVAVLVIGRRRGNF